MIADNAPTGIARKLQESFRDFLHESAEMFGEYGFLGDCERQLHELESGIVRPFNVAVFGRMKTGKSSLINALLGKNLAITGVEETTATINVISRADDPSLCDKFTVHWKDRPPETFPLARLVSDWSGKSKEVIDKVAKTAYIQLYSNDPALAIHEIIDTPGTGSVVADHEKVAQAFLDPSVQEGRKADALIYVFGINGRETDEANLKTFREGCLPGSHPYNSVGVLHKWDATYWNSGGNWDEIQGKADRLKGQMASVVAEVIPVSAPIAMIAARAGDEDLSAILELVARKGAAVVESLLQDDEDWNDDADCAALIRRFSVPWICFRVCVREAIRLGDGTSSSALRSRLRELGGIDRLRSFLDRNFFKFAALIRQRQQYTRFLDVKSRAYARIQDREEELENDSEHWDVLFERSLDPDDLSSWIERKRFKAKSELETLLRKWTDQDERYINSGIPRILEDLAALDWCASHPELVSEAELASLKAMADKLAGDTAAKPDVGVLLGIKKRFAALRVGVIDAAGRKKADYLVRRIDAVLYK
ncbi:MAG: dynamin family protein [Paludibacteraceae bacterium]|nr:dynamin family protein [Paludibacteraceae bacterium]